MVKADKKMAPKVTRIEHNPRSAYVEYVVVEIPFLSFKILKGKILQIKVEADKGEIVFTVLRVK